MGVLLHAHYRLMGPHGHKIVMPAPIDEATPHAPWWWDHLANQAAELRRVGFSAVLLPPVCKTVSGSAPDADGYGLYDNYDIGSKKQPFEVPTRFGDGERLRRMIAVMHACGLDVYADVVMHQYNGGHNGVYEYPGADGKQRNGRFPKHPSCFVGKPPRVPVDPVANPVGNFAFGDMVAYINGKPKGYMLNGAIDAGDWLTRTLDLEGYRLDDVKGMAVEAVREFLNSKSMAGRFSVGEYFDGNPSALHWWVRDSGMGGRCKVFDFTLHWAIQAMCNNESHWRMAALEGAGYIAVDPLNAVTFVDNPDTDLSPGESVISNKLLGYALILTAEGYPCIYYKDYSTDHNCYGLKPYIDNLIWIHENLAFGATLTRWGNDPQVYIFERQGHPGLLVGLNNDARTHTRTVQTSFGAHAQLHEYTGNHDDIWTDADGKATFTLPRNHNGHSYLCFSRPGYEQPFSLHRRTTTQTFFGAADLDMGPVENDKQIEAGRVWCDTASTINLHLESQTRSWTANSAIIVEIVDPHDRVIATKRYTAEFGQEHLKTETASSGWFTFRLSGRQLPDPAHYSLTITYTATQHLK